jgi:hypothetical protein
MIGNVAQDLRYTVRQLRKSPRLSAAQADPMVARRCESFAIGEDDDSIQEPRT